MTGHVELTFASYNIHKAVGLDRKRDPERILSVLREIDADIIALQEVDRRIGQRATVLPRALLDDTPWKPVRVAKRPRSLGWHGNALLIRRSMKALSSEPLDLPMLEPRGAVRADLDAGDCQVRVVGMHLDLSGLRRRDQIKAVLDDVGECNGDLPTVILGDFNQWGQTTGAMREFGPDWTMIAPGRSFPSRQPLAHFDRVVISSQCECLAAEVHHTALSAAASDHLPIVARIRLPTI